MEKPDDTSDIIDLQQTKEALERGEITVGQALTRFFMIYLTADEIEFIVKQKAKGLDRDTALKEFQEKFPLRPHSGDFFGALGRLLDVVIEKTEKPETTE